MITSAEFVKGILGTDPILYDGVSQIAFVGRSNVGKSSLINALTGRKNLVKVSNKPGKTTEINFFRINNEFYLVDLPGYGYARLDPKRREKLRKMMLWYLTYADFKPKLVVLVIDLKVGITPFDRQMIKLLRENGHNFVIAANKSDKLSGQKISKQLRLMSEQTEANEVIVCSAVKKGGSNELLQRILQ